MVEQKIRGYEIQSVLGKGAMGVVYKAYDPLLDRFAAIKLMSTGGEVDEELRTRFFREARSAAKLHHPNIVGIHQMGIEENQPFIVMEYVEGEDLKAFLKKKAFIPFDQKLELMIQVGRGLHYAHERGVVHRDVKPGNIRVTRDGSAKILDFGLARLGSSEITRTGMLMGTPYYMSPEQVKGARDLDGRSDLFCLGVVLYELISLHRPFEGETPTSVWFQIVSEPHPPLTQTLHGCPSQLAEIIDRALAKDRAARFATGQEFAEALKRFLARLPQEQEALNLKVRDLQEQFEQRRSAATAIANSYDPALFELEQVDGDPNDFGVLLLRCEILHRRLQAIEERHERIGALLGLIERCQQELNDEELERCSNTLQEIFQIDPENTQARRLQQDLQKRIDERHREQQRRLRLNAALDVARKAFAQGHWEQCLQAVSSALTLESNHSEALELQRSAQAALERQQKVEALLAAARGHFQAERYEDCQKAAAEALQLDPRHTELADLLQRAGQALERQRRVQSLLQAAQKHVAERQYAGALPLLKDLLALEPEHKQALELQRSAQAALERQQRVDGLLATARGHFQGQRYEDCQKAAAEALQLDPRHTELADLLQRASQALEKIRLQEERRDRTSELLEFSRAELEQGNFQSALENLVFLLALEPGHSEALKLKKVAEEGLTAQTASVEADATVLRVEADATILKEHLRTGRKTVVPIPLIPAPAEKAIPTARELAASDLSTVAIASERTPAQPTPAEQPPAAAELRTIERNEDIPPPSRVPKVTSVDRCAPAITTVPTRPTTKVPWRLAGGLAATLGVAALIIVLLAGGSESPAVPPAPGTLTLNVLPWAKVDSITSVADGRAVERGNLITPCRVELPAGDYRIKVSNPHFGRPLEFEVTITAGQDQHVDRTLPNFDPAQEFSRY